MTDMQVEEVVQEQTTTGNQKYTHIVSPPENIGIFAFLQEVEKVESPTAQDIVDFARKHVIHVKALCGYEWVPDDDPEKYDACQICMDVAGMHMRNAGE